MYGTFLNSSEEFQGVSPFLLMFTRAENLSAAGVHKTLKYRR